MDISKLLASDTTEPTTETVPPAGTSSTPSTINAIHDHRPASAASSSAAAAAATIAAHPGDGSMTNGHVPPFGSPLQQGHMPSPLQHLSHQQQRPSYSPHHPPSLPPLEHLSRPSSMGEQRVLQTTSAADVDRDRVDGTPVHVVNTIAPTMPTLLTPFVPPPPPSQLHHHHQHHHLHEQHLPIQQQQQHQHAAAVAAANTSGMGSPMSVPASHNPSPTFHHTRTASHPSPAPPVFPADDIPPPFASVRRRDHTHPFSLDNVPASNDANAAFRPTLPLPPAFSRPTSPIPPRSTLDTPATTNSDLPMADRTTVNDDAEQQLAGVQFATPSRKRKKMTTSARSSRNVSRKTSPVREYPPAPVTPLPLPPADVNGEAPPVDPVKAEYDAFLDALGLPEPPATKLDDTMLKDIKKLEEHKVNSFRKKYMSEWDDLVRTSKAKYEDNMALQEAAEKARREALQSFTAVRRTAKEASLARKQAAREREKARKREKRRAIAAEKAAKLVELQSAVSSASTPPPTLPAITATASSLPSESAAAASPPPPPAPPKEEPPKNKVSIKLKLTMREPEEAPAVPVVAEPVVEDYASSKRKVWQQISTRLIPSVHAMRNRGKATKLANAKRISILCSKEMKKLEVRAQRQYREALFKSRRANKEMLAFWRKNEREEKEKARRAEKEALEEAKREEEAREARRQARKLNFLITQTELFSHFVGARLGDAATTGPEPAATSTVQGANGETDATTTISGPVDFADETDEQLRARAAQSAQTAYDIAQQRAKAFDAPSSSTTAAATAGDKNADVLANMDFQHPSSMPTDREPVTQPALLRATLKPYQLQGLSWLANLYEQGINGILADEMGLGKTIQSISLMAYLAEKENVWGPFLVITPTSTLHNWEQEISRFTPELRPLPYWGEGKDRASLRSYWNRKIAYTKDTPYHVVVTSYAVAVQDIEYLKKQKWQYMILDEAHAIKSSSSVRWQMLMRLSCRNRLLLTGTPVQNNMRELWALLNFIMPSLFDSHEEFNAWFSSDIENSVKKGSMADFNEHQLKRLHMILKPFMLRRVKRDVQNELGEKIERSVYCTMTHRQRQLYRGLKSRISIVDLLAKLTMDSSDPSGMDSLMNLVTQFRKVCNHPELFERADVKSPFVMGHYGGVIGSHLHAEERQSGKDLAEIERVSRNVQASLRGAITYRLPKLCYRDPISLTDPLFLSASQRLSYVDPLLRRFDIFHPLHLHSSSSSSSFYAMIDLSPNEVYAIAREPLLKRWLRELQSRSRRCAQYVLDHDADADADAEPRLKAASRLLFAERERAWRGWQRASPLYALQQITTTARPLSYLQKCAAAYQTPVVAPPPNLDCADQRCTSQYEDSLQDQDALGVLTNVSGFITDPAWQTAARPVIEELETHQQDMVGAADRGKEGWSSLQVPHLSQLYQASAKMAVLDQMLPRLKAEGHKCLIYFQMTKMMDIFEEYLTFRQYQWVRLDGTTDLSDRRDRVAEYQTRPDLFIFLLSTRAGGIGINLTAADTVIFYDSDWNPTVDQQAMDRAHRLGQTRQVTVYRLITQNTIEEKILQQAQQKDQIQKMVIAGGSLMQAQSNEPMKPKEIMNLLLDDDEMGENLKRTIAQKEADEAAKKEARRVKKITLKRKEIASEEQ